MYIEGKTAVITGGANGLGYCYAAELLKNKAKFVALLDLENSNGEESAAKLEKEFGEGRVAFYVCDVTDGERFTSVVKEVAENYGLDIIINNAGILHEVNWELTLNVNVGAVIRSTVLGLEIMGKHNGGKGGTIVNIASIAGLMAVGNAPVYCCTKHAVVGFSRGMAMTTYEKTGVRILVMCPGGTETAILKNSRENDRYLSVIDLELGRNQMRHLPRQKTEPVAKAMIELIEKGETGTVVVSENNEPPYVVDFPPYSAVKKPL